MKKKEKEIPLWAKTGHSRPQTRREFLASGLLKFSAALSTPALLTLLARDPAAAQALGCGDLSAGGSGLAPFITLNLAGGAAMAANFVPMDQALQPLPSYNVMGLGNGQVPIERAFGNVPFAGNGISKLLAGIRARATTATLDKTAFVGVCVRTRDDSGENRLDLSGLLYKAGLTGRLLPNMGRVSTLTGIRQMAAYASPPAPLVINNVRDLRAALAYDGALNRLNSDQKARVANAIRSMSVSQSRKLASAGIQGARDLIECATSKNVALVGVNGGDTDPNANTALQTLWGINSNTNTGDQSYIMASMVYTAINGSAGTVNLELGGYDYHDNSRTTGDNRDRNAGELIGRILETARIMNQKIFLYVTSDGAVSSPESEARDAIWTSDRGSAGASYMIAFDPSGRPSTSSFQLGHFTSGQAADDKFIIGNDPARAAGAVFLNYLKWNGRMDLAAPSGVTDFDAAQIDQILRFA